MSPAPARCPCCESESLIGRAALSSLFLANYVFHAGVETCSVNECRDCSLLFYWPRLTDDQIARLYRDYRGEEYFRARHRQEFWYTRRYNSRLGDEAEMAHRRRRFQDSVARHRGARDIETVLDYGGDRGQLLTEGPGRKRAVFDLSGTQPLSGIERVSSEEALAGRRFDLVVLAHVLEHVSAPTALATKLRSLVAPNGLFFVAVPDERIPLHDLPAGRWYSRYLDAVRRVPPLTILLDFYSTAVRVKFRRIPPLGFAKLHEHQNLFSLSALAKCLELSGFRVLECNSGGGEIVGVGEAG